MRGKRARKRTLNPDPLFKSKVVARMISVAMTQGKKSIAREIVYSAIKNLNEDEREALRIFEQAVKNVMPQQEVRSRRVGGATYQVPIPLKHDRSEALAVRWIIGAARSKRGRPMVEKLHDILMDSYQNVGDAIKKRDDVHKMAEANRAFAHFARF
ncbi:30S ribosomal protein S7 [candidate division WWE3 bacterium]|uniref:Small ribosomal subunit protein uS7 n=1 Tax=candidate division WWE3 bacterium TaxID=2053526 RepID=A0A7X9E6L7_UNCKA|nr:30S ribosomal protein S7 [candidate division WWE3 bacterium]